MVPAERTRLYAATDSSNVPPASSFQPFGENPALVMSVPGASGMPGEIPGVLVGVVLSGRFRVLAHRVL